MPAIVSGMCLPEPSRSIRSSVWQLTPTELVSYVPKLTTRESERLFKSFAVFAIPERQDGKYSWKHSTISEKGGLVTGFGSSALTPSVAGSRHPSHTTTTMGQAVESESATVGGTNALDCDLVVVTRKDFQRPARGWFVPRREYAELRVDDVYGGLERVFYSAEHVQPIHTLSSVVQDNARPQPLQHIPMRGSSVSPSSTPSPGITTGLPGRSRRPSRSFFSPLPSVDELVVLSVQSTPGHVASTPDPPSHGSQGSPTSTDESDQRQSVPPPALPPISQYQSAFVVPYAIQNAIVRHAVDNFHVRHISKDKNNDKVTRIAKTWLQVMSTLPPLSTFLNLAGMHTDPTNCWRILKTDHRAHSRTSKASPAKRRRVGECLLPQAPVEGSKRTTQAGRPSAQKSQRAKAPVSDIPLPVHGHARHAVRTWLKDHRVVVVGRVDWPESFAFLGQRTAVLDSGRMYLCASLVYTPPMITRLLVRFVHRILQSERFSDYIHETCTLVDARSGAQLDATRRHIHTISKSVMKRVAHKRAVASASFRSAPACVKAVLSSQVPLVNHIRMQLGAVVANAAVESGLDWHVLAEPMFDVLRTNPENADRIPELRKWIEYAVQNPMDTRLCHTRKGPDYYKSELTCPFKGGCGNDNVSACLADRGIPFKVGMDLNAFTVSQMWTSAPSPQA